VSSEDGAETIHEAQVRTAEERLADAAADPIVAAVLNKFPGAEIVDVRIMETEEPSLEASPPDDEPEEE